MPPRKSACCATLSAWIRDRNKPSLPTYKFSAKFKQSLKDWIPGKPPQRGPTSRDDTVWGRAGCVSGLGCRSPFGRGNGVACLEETSGLCGKRTLPPQSTGSRVKHALAWDDTVYSLVELVSGEPFHHFTFPPFHLKNTFPTFHDLFIAPIYMGELVPHLHHLLQLGSSGGHP